MMQFLGCATGVLKPLKRITDMAPKDPTNRGIWVLGSRRYICIRPMALMPQKAPRKLQAKNLIQLGWGQIQPKIRVVFA